MTLTKVAIYGDSFADPIGGHAAFPEMTNQSWTILLKEHYDITCFGKASTSIYYSHKKFLETYMDYDKIIFLVTDPYRWPLSLKVHGNDVYLNTITSVEENLDNSQVSYEEFAKLHSLKNYYMYLLDRDLCVDYANLMVQDIISKCEKNNKQLILMHNWSEPDIPTSHNVTTTDYLNLFLNNYKDSFSDPIDLYSKYFEKKTVCHLSVVINKLLADDMHQALQTGIWDPKLPESVPHQEPFDYYFGKYPKKKNLKLIFVNGDNT